MSVIRFAKPGHKSASPGLLQLLERKPRLLAAVAPANKIPCGSFPTVLRTAGTFGPSARIIWAMMARGEAYRRQPITAWVVRRAQWFKE